MGDPVWFVVDHGLDSYEEVIDLQEVIFLRTGFSYREGTWNYRATLALRNGRKETIHFSEKGYEEFKKLLGVTMEHDRGKA